MNSFGLGLVLNFVDNASAGMNTATANFNRMSATADSMTSSVSTSATEMAAIAYSLSAVGNTFSSIGESIMGVFSGITERVINTGGEMLNYRMQLSALYGSVEAGEAKMEDIKKYAMSSVFEIQSLIPAVTMMKAVGIEALQEITTSSGSATQKLLDYASDLAAMIPNMRNVYGTGVQAAMGAFKEYIAEGNAVTLKRGAGLNITAILGEDKGKTVEERTQQVADLIDKLNIVGYTANLAGTPMQRLSNMQDALFNSISKIADSGVFEAYCTLLETLSDWVFGLVENEETFNAITGVLSETITALLSPLQKMLDFVIRNSDAIIGWIKENPKLVKSILLTVAAIGSFLVVGGSLLKLLSSIAFAMSGLNVIKSLPSLLGLVGKAFSALISKALPFVALAALAYFVWKNNLFGIRDVVTDVMNDLGTIISLVSDAWSDNTLSEENFLKAKELGILPLINSLLQLKYYWDFFVEGFKTGFKSFFDGIIESLSCLQVMGIDVNALTSSVGELLNSLVEVGAEEKWERIGKIVGDITAAVVTLAVMINVIKPIISIISGIVKVSGGILSIFKVIGGVLKIVFNPLIKAVPFILGFFKDMGAAISLIKEGFGFFEVMGAWFPKLAGFITKFGSIFVKIGGIFSKFSGWIVAGAKAIGSAIMGVLTSVAGLLGLPVGAVVAIIAAIVAVVALIVIFRDEIAQFFVWLWGKITEFGSWLFSSLSTLFSNLWSSVSGWFSKVFEKVREVISNIVQAILNNPVVQSVISVMKSIYNVIAGIVKTIATVIAGVAKVIWSIIKMIGTIIAGVAKVIWAVVSGIVKTIWANIKGLFNFIATVVVGIWNVIKSVVNLIWTAIKTAGQVIMSIARAVYQFFRMVFYAILAVGKVVIMSIVNFFEWLWGKIRPILQAIGNFFKFIFDWVRDNIIKPVVDWIVFAFNWVRDKILAVLTTIGNFFSNIFNWISNNIITPFRDFIGGVFDWISEKADIVTSWLSNSFDTAANWIKTAFDGVVSFFTGVWDSITSGAETFFNWISEKLSWLTEKLSGIGDFFSGIANGVGDFFSSAGDKLKGFVGLDTGGYVKTTGIAVLHPNEVVVNDDTTKRLQNFLGNYEDDNLSGISNSNSPKAVLNNIYPTVMESVPVTTVPAEEVSNVNNNSSFVSNTTQNIVQHEPVKVVEKTGETHNDYSVTFASGSIVIQLLNASDAELEKAAEKIMKIIARKQQLRAMAVRR